MTYKWGKQLFAQLRSILCRLTPLLDDYDPCSIPGPPLILLSRVGSLTEADIKMQRSRSRCVAIQPAIPSQIWQLETESVRCISTFKTSPNVVVGFILYAADALKLHAKDVELLGSAATMRQLHAVELPAGKTAPLCRIAVMSEYFAPDVVYMFLN